MAEIPYLSFRDSYNPLISEMPEGGAIAVSQVAQAYLTLEQDSQPPYTPFDYTIAITYPVAGDLDTQFLASLLRDKPDLAALEGPSRIFFDAILEKNGTPGDYMQLLNLTVNGQCPWHYVTRNDIPNEFTIECLTHSKVDEVAHKLFDRLLIKIVEDQGVYALPKALKRRAAALFPEAIESYVYLAQVKDFDLDDQEDRLTLAKRMITRIGDSLIDQLDSFTLDEDARYELYQLYTSEFSDAVLNLDKFNLSDLRVADVLRDCTDPLVIASQYEKMEDETAKSLCLEHLERLGVLPAGPISLNLKECMALTDPLKYFDRVVFNEAEFSAEFSHAFFERTVSALLDLPANTWFCTFKRQLIYNHPRLDPLWDKLYPSIFERIESLSQEAKYYAYEVAIQIARKRPDLPLDFFPATTYRPFIQDMRQAYTYDSFTLHMVGLKLGLPYDTKMKKLIRFITTHRNEELQDQLERAFRYFEKTINSEPLKHFKRLIEAGLPVHLYAPIMVLCVRGATADELDAFIAWGYTGRMRYKLRENASGFMQVVLKTLTAMNVGEVPTLLSFLDPDPDIAKATFNLLFFAYANRYPPSSREELHFCVAAAFETSYGIKIDDIPDFQVRYENTFGNLRHKGALEAYLAGLKPLVEEDRVLGEELASFVRSVLLGTYPKERYSTVNSPHLAYLKAHHESLFTTWTEDTFEHEGQEISDRWDDLFLIGDSPASCMKVYKTPENNKCLIATVMDGGKKVLIARDSQGKMVLRALLYLLVDKENQPFLFLEKPYGALTPEVRAILPKFYETAKAYATHLKIGLATVEDAKLSDEYVRYTPLTNYPSDTIDLHHKGSPFRHHYIDSGERAPGHDHLFVIRKAIVTHRPPDLRRLFIHSAIISLASAAACFYFKAAEDAY